MLTVGVDLATQPSRTGIAAVRWEDGHATVESLNLGVTDDDIVRAASASDSLGIDAPLGWPDAFVTFLNEHRGDAQGVFSYAETWPGLAFRATDRYVREFFGVTPLSVSTDRLGLTALRASVIQARLRDAGYPVDRAGGGSVIEVYPAVALRQWGLSVGSYKGANRGALGALLDRLQSAAPWLELGDHGGLCRSSDDAFDALVSALIARAHALGAWHRPPDHLTELAGSEGWIIVPDCALERLPQQ